MREKARKFWTLSSMSARGCKKKKKSRYTCRASQ